VRARQRASAACLAMLPVPAGVAAEPGKVDEVIEELFLGEIAFPQDALELQVTADLGGARAGDVTTLGGGVEVEFGITDRLQLAARVPLARVSAPMERHAGLGNASLEALYNPLSDRGRGLALSVGLELSLPSPSGAGEDAWTVEAFAALYKVLGRVHANLSVGVELEREVSPSAALGVFAPIGRWAPVLELRVEAEAEPAAVVSAGALWHPIDDLELGAAVQVGLDARSFGGFLLATFELELGDDNDDDDNDDDDDDDDDDNDARR